MRNGRPIQSIGVTTDGKNLVSRAGAALLSELAVRSSLTEAMSGIGINWHNHDPGVVLTHLAVWPSPTVRIAWPTWPHGVSSPNCSGRWLRWHGLAGGGCIHAFELQTITEAIDAARAKVWAAAPPVDSLVLDFDATLVNSCSHPILDPNLASLEVTRMSMMQLELLIAQV